jgi:hypothetical protein
MPIQAVKLLVDNDSNSHLARSITALLDEDDDDDDDAKRRLHMQGGKV